MINISITFLISRLKNTASTSFLNILRALQTDSRSSAFQCIVTDYMSLQIALSTCHYSCHQLSFLFLPSLDLHLSRNWLPKGHAVYVKHKCIEFSWHFRSYCNAAVHVHVLSLMAEVNLYTDIDNTCMQHRLDKGQCLLDL